MPTAGPYSPGTVVSDGGTLGGTVAWSDPGNATASDDSRATATVGNTVQTHGLKATNFSPTIPDGATITDILLEIEYSRPGPAQAACKEYAVKYVGADGSYDSTNKSTGAALPTTEAYTSYTWSGLSLPKSDVTDSDFGFVFGAEGTAASGSARVDHFRVTYTYTEAPSYTGGYEEAQEMVALRRKPTVIPRAY